MIKMLFFKIAGIEINLTILISFFSGILMGMLIIALLYLFSVIKGLKQPFKHHDAQEEDIDEEEIKWLIKDAQNQFNNKTERELEGYGTMLLRINKDLARDIATKFYPKSKYPFLELTIDEGLALIGYIEKRVDELFEAKFLKMFRGLTIRRIVELKDTKDVIENTKLGKTAKKYNKITGAIFATLNAVNPAYWFKKIVVNNAMNIVMVKIGLVIIGITGEETYKIYSKKVFNEERSIDSNLEDIYQEINQNIVEGLNEEK